MARYPAMTAKRRTFVIIFTIATVFLVAYWVSIAQAIRIWSSSGAYNYCFAVLPISLYMVWRNRTTFVETPPTSDLLGVIIAFGASLAWGAATLAGIAELAQFAAVTVLQGCVIAAIGWPLYRRNATAFLYCYLMVPTGAALLSPLQSLTARIGTAGLSLLAIPVFRDGPRLEAPSGDFLVAPGCAGLNFLLAGLAVAIAVGELHRESLRRRLALIVAMALVGILGNGLRVSLIIAIAEWTGSSSIIDDHLLLGWALFSLLMLAVLIADARLPGSARPPAPPRPAPASRVRSRGVALALPLAVAAIPALLWLAPSTAPIRLVPPELTCGPLASQPATDAAKLAAAADGDAAIACDSPAGPLQVEIALLDRPVRRTKLIGFERRWADKGWERLSLTHSEAGGPDGPVPVRAEHWIKGGAALTVWSLFWADGAWRADGWAAAVADLRSDLVGRRRSALVQLRLPGSGAAVDSVLSAYLAAQPLPEIR